MAKQLVAVLLLCIVVLAAVHIEKAEADAQAQFKTCYDECHKGCFNQDGNGYTFCEMKCDADCGEKEIKAKVSDLI